MNFFVQKNSTLPIHVQIHHQIKLALLLGNLRPGDTLPSIRDLAKQIGVNRGMVHRAYMELQDAGTLSLQHGKGVIVDKELKYNHRGSINDKAESLSEELVTKLGSSGICPSAFARYLYQKTRQLESTVPFVIFVDVTKAQAMEHASRISSLWQVHIDGLSIDELVAMDSDRLKRVRKALTTYLRLDEVRKALRRTSIEVIPIGLRVNRSTLREFKKYPNGASVVLIMDDRDFPSSPFMLDLYRRELLQSSTTISAVAISKIRNLRTFLNSSKFHRFIFTTRVWETLPDPFKKHPRVTHPQMDIDLASVESARYTAGIIV
jgi:GntR family transcriptional regulator